MLPCEADGATGVIDSARNGWSQTLVMSFTKPVPPLVCTTKTDGKRRRVNRLVLLFEAAVQESLRSCCKSIFFPLEPPQRLMGIFYRSQRSLAAADTNNAK